MGQLDLAEFLAYLARQTLRIGFSGLDAAAGQDQLGRVAVFAAQQDPVAPKDERTYFIEIGHTWLFRLEMTNDQIPMTN
jgi:hypothetical protein